ncbi:MAG TPA: glycosyltransferase family A protein [Solirubrobacterales bacterium]|nr:glycosyltransferase family A protein [Solirubrobacterales bacterium]
MAAPAPGFSVLIPAYEAAATIGEAIASARAQTRAPSEIIVCDDGSSDDLAAALEPHREAIRLIAGEHRGVAAARNRLLAAATAEFVVPLDADDVYAPTRLERLADLAAARPGLDILATDAHLSSSGEVVGRFGENTPFALQEQAQAILERCFVICPAMRRSRLLELGGYDESLRTAEDWDVCIRLILTGSEAGLVDEPLLEYRLGSESLTSGRAQTLRERVYVLEKATATTGLDRPVRRAAEQAVSHHRGRALEQAAIEAVARRDSKARHELFAVARSRDVNLRARLGAALAGIAPENQSRRIVEATLWGSSGRPRGWSGG